MSAIETTHAVGDDVGLLAGVERAVVEATRDLAAHRFSTRRDASGRADFSHENLRRQLLQVLGHTVEVLDFKPFTESQNAVSKNNIHSDDLPRPRAWVVRIRLDRLGDAGIAAGPAQGYSAG